MTAATHPLDRLVQKLDAMSRRPSSIEIVRAVEGRLAVSDVAPFVQVSAHNYNRALVVVREHYEALIMTWAPGQASVPHDHGGSACVMKVVQGVAAEGSYHIAADGFVDLEFEELLTAGDTASLQDSGVHSVRNASPDGETLVTLHVYAPPLQACRRFIPRRAEPVPPHEARTPTVAIVGGGFSGAMTAAHILRCAESPIQVALIERRGALGEGVAYSTQEPAHLLNVPAGRMSARPDRPDDFVEWASRRYGDVRPTDFLPRQWYGAYIRDSLIAAKDESRAASLSIHFDEVRRVAKRPTAGWTLHMGRGASIRADAVVLAIGHSPPSDPLAGKWLGPRTRYIGDPWQSFALDKVRPDERVLVLGSGLTAVDAVLSIARQPRSAEIVMVSPRGVPPLSHGAAPLPAADLSGLASKLLSAPGGVRARTLIREMRQAAREFGAQGWDWRSVVDGLRPFTAPLWRAMPTAERRRFLLRIRPFWEVHRHRMARQVGERFARMLESGQLRILAGRVEMAREDGGEVKAIVRPRKSRDAIQLTVGWVVNCTGPLPSNRPESNPAIGSLLAQGRLCIDELALGIEAGEDGAVIAADGVPSPGLFAVGTLRKPSFWESTAVPELREQAASVATRVLDLLKIHQEQS